MNKKSLISLFTGLLITVLVSFSFAVVPAVQRAELNGQLKFTLDQKAVFPSGNDGQPVYPLTVDGVTYLPLRGVGNLLGYDINYSASTKSIALQATGTGSRSADKLPSPTANQKLKGVQYVLDLNFSLAGKPVTLKDASGNVVNPVSFNGTTYLPLRALATLMALDIGYDGKAKTINIVTSAVNTGTPNVAITPLTQVWRLAKVEFVDGSGTKPTRLMGTTATMTDTVSYQGTHEGEAPSLTITSVRTDDATGKLLAGVSYQIGWTAPPEVLRVGEKPSMRFNAKTLSSTTWKMNQVSMTIDQGMGVNFASEKGLTYLTGDFDYTMVMLKEVAKGPSNFPRQIKVELGAGFRVIYHYNWLP